MPICDPAQLPALIDGLAPRMTDLVVGDDGRARCRWGASTPEYARYHDEEWGKPVHDADALYEQLCLEAFQSGLSWLTILRKRENSARRSPASRSPPSRASGRPTSSG